MTDYVEFSADVEEDTLKGRFLTFKIGKETYGIGIGYVTEIIGIQNITEMPEAPEYIKGILNLRGRVIPVMDVRLRFSKAQRDYDDRTCIIVAECDGISTGLIVDSMSEVINLGDECIVQSPHGSIGLREGFVKSIGKVGNEVILLLDCQKLVFSECA